MTRNNVRDKFKSMSIILILVLCGIINFIPTPPIVPWVSAESEWIQTSDSDFIQGTFDNVTLVGSGNDAEVRMDLNFGWTKKSPSPSPGSLEFHKMAMINGTDKVVLFGGMIEEDDTWVYDFSDDKWTLKSTHQLLLGRYDFGFASIYNDDKVLLYAGSGSILGCFNDQWLYDLSNDTWTEIQPSGLIGGRYSTTMAPIYWTDNVLLFGGYGFSSYLNDTWIFDLSLNSWTQHNTTTSPSPRQYHAMAPIAGTDNILLFGGFDGITPFNDTWIYDLSDNSWTNITTAITPSARINHAMTTIDCTNMVVLYGGYDGNQYFRDTWIFDLSSKTWSEIQLPNQPEARAGHAMATIYNNCSVIIHGGRDSTNTYSDTWIYNHTGVSETGAYISAPFDTGTNSTFNSISWDSETPEGTSIEFQVRTAASKSNLTSKPFLGPDGTCTAYYKTSPTTIWPGHAGDRWIQYRAYFASSEKFVVLSLKAVTIIHNNWPIAIIISPSNGSIISDDHPTFRWSMTDDSDQQTACQIIIDNDPNFIPPYFDSGEMVSSEQDWKFSAGTNYAYDKLSDGRWYWKVRIKDSDNAWGDFCPMEEFLIDTTPPESVIKIPTDKEYYNYLEIISGIANDFNGSGVSRVEIALKRIEDDQYWTGSSWVTSETWLLAFGANDWYYDLIDVPLGAGTEYFITSRAIDILNYIEIPTGGVTFYFDNIDPISSIDFPKNSKYINDLNKITGTANDMNGSGVEFVKVTIRCITDDKYWDTEHWIEQSYWINALGNETWSIDTSTVSWVAGYEYMICSRAVDKIGNTEFPGVKVYFTYDDISPVAIKILINDDEKYTNKTHVNLSLFAEDIDSGVDKMCLSTDSLNWTAWVPFKSNYDFKLSSGDGEKFVYFRIRDIANNTSPPVYDKIILDTTPPTNLSISIKNGSKITAYRNVTLTLEAWDQTSGVHLMSFNTTGKKWTDWQNFSSQISYILSPGEGVKTVEFKVKDHAGNIGGPISTTIIYNSSINTNGNPIDENDDPAKFIVSDIPDFLIFGVFIFIMVIIVLIILIIRKKRSPQKIPEKPVIMVKRDKSPKPPGLIEIESQSPSEPEPTKETPKYQITKKIEEK
jgi:hypothetical protein